MIDVHFEINSRRVSPDQMACEMERAVLLQVKDHIAKQLRDVRDPKTGRPPRIMVKGHDLSNLHFHVEGSEEVIQEVKRRLS